MKEQIFRYLTYFIVYSILGWIIESIFRSISEKKLINTGFLHGPFCPIYGFGACIMFLFLDRFSNNISLLFIISFVVLTIWEYIVAVWLEKTFDTKYWDYSDQKINFKGRICLVNSIYWGILGVVFIKIIHPLTQKGLDMINYKWEHYAVIVILTIVIIDTIITIVRTKNIKVSLKKAEELKQRLSELRAKSPQTVGTENMQKLAESLKNKRESILLKLYRNTYRLKKAFPTIDTKEIRDILNRKIEIEQIKMQRKKRKAKSKK